MKKEEVRVTFYPKRSEADNEGRCPIMVRLSVGRFSKVSFSLCGNGHTADHTPKNGRRGSHGRGHHHGRPVRRV